MSDQLAWFKSSHSDNEGGDCVEVAVSHARLTVHVRDSKNPTGPTLTLPAGHGQPLALVCFLPDD
ncbi:DUF397 domain-containing protein, partial [Streptomyces caniscabiei]|uniref:DUF397 domain-containing protein n=1 Tax=Streptomyces caniscabiei TaxID=2746961 RepID=UPI000D1B06BA